MSAFKIFHNSRCSKSRQALQILQDSNCDIEIINYLEADLDVSLIKDVLKKLSLKPRDILRTSEQDYNCLLYTSPSPRDKRQSRMPSSA